MPILRAQPDKQTRKPVTVRAIHANAGLEAWYAAKLDALIADMHDAVRDDLLSVYQSVISPPSIAQDAPRNPSLVVKRALRNWGDRWIARFDELSGEISKQFATKAFGMTQTAMRAALKDAGFTVQFSPTPASRAAYQATVAEQVNLIKSIPAEYLKAVESQVWQSVMKGGDMHALSTNLRETYGITRRRAAMIARDQNNKAKAVIERTRRTELGIEIAIWQHSGGSKVPRYTHVVMSGKPFKIAVGMWDSAVGRYVQPGELIECKCTSRAVIKAFETVEQAMARSPRNTPALRRAAARAR